MHLIEDKALITAASGGYLKRVRWDEIAFLQRICPKISLRLALGQGNKLKTGGREFLKIHPEFEIDKGIEHKLPIMVAPNLARYVSLVHRDEENENLNLVIRGHYGSTGTGVMPNSVSRNQCGN